MSHVMYMLLVNLALCAGMLGLLTKRLTPALILLLVVGALAVTAASRQMYLRRSFAVLNGLIIILLGLWSIYAQAELLMLSAATTVFGLLSVWLLYGSTEETQSLRQYREKLSATVAAMASLIPFWLGLRQAALTKETVAVKVALVLLGLLCCFLSWLGLHGNLLRRGAARFTIAATLLLVLTGAFLVASSSAHAVVQAPAWAETAKARYQQWMMPPTNPTKPSGGMKGSGELDMSLPPTPDKISNDPRAFLMLTKETAQSGIKQPFYLRRKAFDHFTGKRWAVQSQDFEWSNDEQDGTADGWVTVGQPVRTPLYDHAVFIPGQRNHEMLSLPGPCLIGVPLLMRGPNDSFLIPARQGQNIGYTVRSSYYRYEEIRRKPIKPGSASEAFLQIPDSPTVNRLRAETAVLLQGANSPRQRVARIVRHLRANYVYSDRRLPPKKDALAEFLYDRKKGHCTLFATASTLMLRSAGFPARVASGYYKGRFDAKASVFMFNDHDRHAWTEVLLEDYGWVLIDCTPAGDSTPTVADSGFRITAEQLQFLGKPRLGLTPSLRRRTTKNAGIGIHGRQIAICFMAALVAGAFCSLLILIRRMTAPRPKEGYASAKRDPSFFRLFCRHFAKCGCPRRRSQTGLEYATTLKSRGLIDNEFDDMLAYLYSVRYAGTPASRQQESLFKKKVRALKVTKPE